MYPPINVGQQRDDSEQRPGSTDAEHKYPTVLFVYGGPHVQVSQYAIPIIPFICPILLTLPSAGD